MGTKANLYLQGVVFSMRSVSEDSENTIRRRDRRLLELVLVVSTAAGIV